MKFMLIIGIVLFSTSALTFFLVLFLAFAFADLFKRRLLSNAVVYTTAMLLIPAAALSAVGTPIAALADDVTVGKEVFLILEGLALLAVCLTIYIRGHVSPIDKTLEKYSGAISFYAAKRLISVGIAGNCLYGVLLIESLAEVTALIASGTLLVYGMSVSDLLFLPIMIIAFLFVPFINIILIFLFIAVGAEFIWLGITALMTLIPVLLIANGCIRYIIATDMPKEKKALWIFLSLIPVFNFVYGLICLTKINKYIKKENLS